MRPSFRNGFYAGLLLAVAAGIYLYQLWQPARQVELHSVHFLNAIERKQWAALADFLDETYEDQWGHDRALLLTRVREVIRYTRDLRIEAHEADVSPGQGEGHWRARITVDGDPNEVTALIKERVNSIEAPFDLLWRQQSRKPWDWKLVRVSNPALELP
jgi:hypothetical protein